MKIGVITNLVNIDDFVAKDMATANSEAWMRATGGNTGNVAFVQGIKNILGDSFGIVNWGDNPALVNKHYDQLVICCANQMGAHVDLKGWVERLQSFDLPTTFIGLGAQSDNIGNIPDIPEGSKQFLQLSKSLRPNADEPNIITRGEFSSEVVAHYGVESSPFGCPSQFISTELNLGKRCLQHQKRARYERIMTAAGNPWHPSASIENTLTEIVENNRGDYILQHPKALLQLALGEGGALPMNQIERLEKVYSRIGDWEQIKAWFESFSVFFADAQNWMHYSRHFTLAIGPRYHGVALPIQAGVPGKVISIDSRTEELALTTGIPTMRYTDIDDLNADELIKASRWKQADADNYDAVRTKNAINYQRFLEGNNLPVNQAIAQLATSQEEQ
ncbi:polysaccharide pyruvyl transferase family protein [Alteromonas halophila]|uniref:Polysaccharide pyruvyl transferase family protein n=1 Tax=Alteromonas halophila TaxID=516698 RepID=A0A918N068_9ALTE|nr:polysaccharide pyruvyl transferase family protein [Alteromonas halophila]GGW92539.1 hypothetical protein GCM10007391_28650 [Alteromonas halophila]